MKRLCLSILFLLATFTTAMAGTYTITPLPTDLWDQNPNPAVAYSGTGSAWNNTFARLVVRTSARTATISYYNTNTATAIYPIGVRVNGMDLGQFVSTTGTTGLQTVTALLPAGFNKVVEFISSAQDAQSSSGAPQGCHLVSVAFDEAATVVAPTAANNRLVVYGDSIASGGNAGNDAATAGNPGQRVLKGWVPLIRPFWGNGGVTLEAYGYRSLYADASTAQKQTQLAQTLASYGASTYWIAIGANDWLFGWNAANFGVGYASVMDKLHALVPSAVIYCQSPTITGGGNNREGTNSYGNTLGDYRTATKAVCSTRPWLRFVDGLSIIQPGDISADGIHPGTTGNVNYAFNVLATLGLSPAPSQSAFSLTATALQNPAAPTVTTTGTAGATTWSYIVVARTINGLSTAGSTAGSTTTGNASIANFSGNANIVSWTPVSGAALYDVYRTAVGTNPTTTGKIGSTYGTTFTDTGGLAGDGTTPPTANSTGSLTVQGATVSGATGTSYKALRHGVATLSSGAVTIADVNVTASTRIWPTNLPVGYSGALGVPYISAQSAGSFTISSTNSAATNVVAYEEIEP